MKKIKYFILAVAILVGKTTYSQDGEAIKGGLFNTFNTSSRREATNHLLTGYNDTLTGELMEFNKKWGNYFIEDSGSVDEEKEWTKELLKKDTSEIKTAFENKDVAKIVAYLKSGDTELYSESDIMDKLSDADAEKYVRDIINQEYKFKDENSKLYSELYERIIEVKDLTGDYKEELRKDINKIIAFAKQDGAPAGEVFHSYFVNLAEIDSNFANSDEAVEAIVKATEKYREIHLDQELKKDLVGIILSNEDHLQGYNTVAFYNAYQKLLANGEYEKIDELAKVEKKYNNVIDMAVAIDKHDQELERHSNEIEGIKKNYVTNEKLEEKVASAVAAAELGGQNTGTTINIGAEMSEESTHNVALVVSGENEEKPLIEGKNNTVIGIGHKVKGNGNTVLGDPNEVDGSGNIVIGNNISITGAENNVILGSKAQANGVKNSVVLGEGSVAKEDNVVSVGSEGNERRITNVAEGRNDTDAVNMKQFREYKKEVNKGLSQVAAMASMDFSTLELGEVGIGAGIGHHGDTQSVAVGVGYVPTVNFSVNAKVAVTPGASLKNSTLGAGMMYKFKP